MERHLSDEALLLVSPFRGYEIVAARSEQTSAWRALMARVLFNVLLLGCVGSLVAAGRLVAFHVLFIGVAWGFAPLIQGVTVGVASRLCTRRMGVARAVSLHMAGNGPWLAFFIALAGLLLFSSDVAATLGWLFGTSILLISGLLTIVAGLLTSFAFYRVCGACGTRRAVALVGLEALLRVVLVLGWYASIDNLAPQFLGAR